MHFERRAARRSRRKKIALALAVIDGGPAYACGAHCKRGTPVGAAVGCDGPAAGVHDLGGGHTSDICPARALAALDPAGEAPSVIEALHALDHAGLAPAAGGWLDQPAALAEAVGFARALTAVRAARRTPPSATRADDHDHLS